MGEVMGVLPSVRPHLCNQSITGCVCIVPTTNFIALRQSRTGPNHRVEEILQLADEGLDHWKGMTRKHTSYSSNKV